MYGVGGSTDMAAGMDEDGLTAGGSRAGPKMQVNRRLMRLMLFMPNENRGSSRIRENREKD